MNAENAVPTIAEQFDAQLSALLGTHPERRADYAAWFDALGQRERHLLAVQGLHSQVCNGGFAQWVENGYLDRDLPTLRLALGRLAPLCPLARTVRELVDEATILAGDEAGVFLSDEAHERLDPLDSRYYGFSDEFESAFQAYFVVDWA